MKAAVMYSPGEKPQYVDFPDPIVKNDDEVLVSVKAVALKHLDKSRAKGTHYSTSGDQGKVTSGEQAEAKVVGGDGVCLLPDGTRVYALGVSGMAAEKAIVEKDRIVPVPAGLDDATAAALPNAVFGSAMALRFRAGIEPGDTVLINGAASFTGRVAVQIASGYSYPCDHRLPVGSYGGDDIGFAEKWRGVYAKNTFCVRWQYNGGPDPAFCRQSSQR
jgi:NADPH:quinone reductase-like Zn-dependent oxidoreductase